MHQRVFLFTACWSFLWPLPLMISLPASRRLLERKGDRQFISTGSCPQNRGVFPVVFNAMLQTSARPTIGRAGGSLLCLMHGVLALPPAPASCGVELRIAWGQGTNRGEDLLLLCPWAGRLLGQQLLQTSMAYLLTFHSTQCGTLVENHYNGSSQMYVVQHSLLNILSSHHETATWQHDTTWHHVVTYTLLFFFLLLL